MSALELHRAGIDNSGSFIDAGSVVVIGDGPDQISADYADELLASGGAIETDEFGVTAHQLGDVLDLTADQHAHDLAVDGHA